MRQARVCVTCVRPGVTVQWYVRNKAQCAIAQPPRVQRHWQACTVLAATHCIRQKRPIIWQKRPTNTYAGMHRPRGSVLHCVFRQHHMHMSHQHMWTMCVAAAYGNALQCVCRCVHARGAATGAHGRGGNRTGEEERGRDGETMVQRTALAHMPRAHTYSDSHIP